MAASVDTPALTSIHGRRLGLGPKGELVANSIPITTNAVDAVVTVAGSITSPRAVTIQVNNADGTPIAHCAELNLEVFADANGAAWAATGGSTGLAASVGSILAVVSKKSFRGRTSITGAMTLSWTDNASEVAFLGVVLGSGRTVISAALTTG